MYEQDRGNIKYIERYKQLISFSGLRRRRNITPTDIDGVIDYNGNAFLYLECKLEGKEIDLGQRLALERIIFSHEKAGNPSCVLLFTHNVEPENLIDAEKQIVKTVFRKRDGLYSWQDIASKQLTVLQCVEIFEKYCISLNIDI